MNCDVFQMQSLLMRKKFVLFVKGLYHVINVWKVGQIKSVFLKVFLIFGWVTVLLQYAIYNNLFGYFYVMINYSYKKRTSQKKDTAQLLC
jgi:hypothetical protein